MKKIGRWLDDNILLLLATFLVAFIPLYPKIPLWSPIEQYIVRVRLEDIFIFLTALVFGIQALRKKVSWYSPMFWGILAYAFVGLLSSLNAFYIIKTVPLQPLHIGKTVLHYFRYLEYFSMFFILYGAVKTRQHVKTVLAVFTATVLIISLYGYGQKYFYWPVYSTMNREFSKGVRLYLTQYARVQSTFAGHYDMAAFLVISLPLILALAYQAKSTKARVVLHGTFWIGSWLLVLSASRTPFAAYLVAVALIILLTGFLKPSWKDKFLFIFKKGTLAAVFMLILIYYFGTDLIERLNYLISANPQMNAVSQTANNVRKMILPDNVVQRVVISPQQLQALLPKKENPPSQAVSTDDLAAQLAAAQEEVEATKDVASSVDQPPVALAQPSPKVVAPPLFKGPTEPVPQDVKEEIPDIVEVATISAEGKVETIRVKKKRVYSECALEKELSLCIRLETLWPRAIERFMTSPVLGTGYATLTKEELDVFTEADSTDNNFLRTLGETGVLGFITFYGCALIMLVFAVKNLHSPDTLKKALSIGMIGGTIGLLLNAVYIDVFAASKVAQTYWGLVGLTMAYLLKIPNPTKKRKLSRS